MSGARVIGSVAIVLAAGRGERLGGRAKATLLLPDGRSFVAAIVASARAAGVERVVAVVAAPFAEVTRAAALAAGVDAVVENPAPERGMASSFACGLAAAADAAVALSWPVDHPSVRPQTVAAVLAAASPGGIVVPEHAGRGGHPTAFGAGLFAACLAAADAPDGLRGLVRADPARVRRLPVDDAGTTCDVDTLDDWAKMGSDDPRPR